MKIRFIKNKICLKFINFQVEVLILKPPRNEAVCTSPPEVCGRHTRIPKKWNLVAEKITG